MIDLEVLDFKEIDGDFAQKYFITIGVVDDRDIHRGVDTTHRVLYKWAVESFGPSSARWNWRKTIRGGCFQFRDKSDCLLFRLKWIKNQ